MSKESKWETRRKDDRVATNADQTEYVALSYGASNLDSGTFDDRIAESLDDYEVADPQRVEGWAARDITIENAASDIGLEIRRRQQLLKDSYPFAIDGGRLRYVPSKSLVYEFCLAVSQAPSLTTGDYARLPVAFERLVRDLMICFLGPGTAALRTGWPADEHEDRPTRFRLVIEKLNNMTGEWVWCPDHNRPADPNHVHVKDEGLDVVVWKEVADARAGKLFLLGQCACGNDYPVKFCEIDPQFTRLGQWIKPISYAWPLRFFSTPRHIPNDAYFEQVNREAGFTLDRARITLLAEQHCDYVRQSAKIGYEELIRIVVDGFEAESPTLLRQP
jgi:hypothetical protein